MNGLSVFVSIQLFAAHFCAVVDSLVCLMDIYHINWAIRYVREQKKCWKIRIIGKVLEGSDDRKTPPVWQDILWKMDEMISRVQPCERPSPGHLRWVAAYYLLHGMQTIVATNCYCCNMVMSFSIDGAHFSIQATRFIIGWNACGVEYNIAWNIPSQSVDHIWTFTQISYELLTIISIPICFSRLFVKRISYFMKFSSCLWSIFSFAPVIAYQMIGPTARKMPSGL